MAVATLVRGCVQVLALVVLSRLLTPSEFGVAAVALAVVSVGEIVRDLGLSQAAMREPELSDRARSNLFWANLGLGVVTAGMAAAIAPVLETTMGIEGMAQVIWSVTPVFLLNGAAAQHRSELSRTLQFARLAAVDVIAACVGLALAVVAALAGLGYWALVVQALAAALATLVASLAMSRWRPTRFSPDNVFRRHLRLGGNLAVAQLAHHLGANVDVIALGYTTDTRAVGGYNRAFQLTMAPVALLRTPATLVAIPTMSHVLARPAALAGALLQAQAVLGYSVGILAAVLSGLGEPVVELTLGAQWSAIVPLVAVLAFAAVVQQPATLANWVLVSLGNGRSSRNLSIISAAVRALLVCVGAQFGALGAAVGFLISCIVLWPVATIWSTRRAGLPARPFLVQAVRVLAVTAALVAAARVSLAAAETTHPLVAVALGLTVMIAAGGICGAVPAVRRDARVLADVLRSLARGRAALR